MSGFSYIIIFNIKMKINFNHWCWYESFGERNSAAKYKIHPSEKNNNNNLDSCTAHYYDFEL